MSICHFCYNAHVWAKQPKTEEDYFNTGLNDTNDFSSSTIGDNVHGIQMYLNSGNGRPVEIEVCQWKDITTENRHDGRWHTIARYYPKFCPECGRKLDEYIIGERGQSFEKKKEFIPKPDSFIAVDSEGNEIDYAILEGEMVIEKDKHEFINDLRHESGCSYLLCMDAYDYMKRRNGTKALAIAYMKVKQLPVNSKKSFDERVLDYLKDMQVQGK